MSLQAGDSGGLDSGTDALGEAFYPLYQRLFDEEGDFVGDIADKLAEARMPDTVEMYISRALALGVVSGGLLWIFGTVIGYVIFSLLLGGVGPLTGAPVPHPAVLTAIELLRVPLLILTTGVFFGSIGFLAGFGTLMAIPYSRASAREREINMLLPDAVSFMYALSVGGLNQLEILEAMAKADDTYGEVACEFQSIVQETEYFDTDYRSAIQEQAMVTPSAELAQFLTDMLSIINSGGDMTNFLDDKKEKHMRTAKQQQELALETMELFGEMYMTLSLFPLFLIIILVIFTLMGQAQEIMLFGTVYILIPIIGVAFLVMISTVKQDEPGDGYLSVESGDRNTPQPGQEGLLNLGLVETYTGEYGVFDRIKNREGTEEAMDIILRPHLFFRDNPLYVLIATVPLSLLVVVLLLAAGMAPTSWEGMVASPVWSTFVYVYLPLYINFIPLAIFREWNVISRYSVTKDLSEQLRKLASANNTGLTLLESLKTTADTSTGTLSREFETMHAKVNYGTSLNDALIEFNNKYHIPRLARTVKLISKAQEASSQISDVLTTAAQASENQDDIDRERISRTRMQVVIIIMTYLTLLAVMAILQVQFLGVMADMTAEAEADGDVGGGGMGMGGDVDVDLLSLLFFHAVTMQAILSGFISGYIRDAKMLSGVKFVVGLVTVALVVWVLVG